MHFKKVNYKDLNAKQQESFNYQKISSVLADYGFITVPLANDWNGADFLAIPIEGEVLKIQLKGRLTFMKKYMDKNLYICFRVEHDWYLYPHDELIKELDGELNFLNTPSWIDKGSYSFPVISAKVLKMKKKIV
jgi:hypothetical protein